MRKSQLILILRHLSQITFFVLLLFFVVGVFCSFAIWSLNISCPVGSIQQIFASKTFYVVLIISALPLLILPILFGRFFCSWMCPMGTIYEALTPITNRIKSPVKLPSFLRRQSNKMGVAFGSFLAAGIASSPAWCTVCPVGAVCKSATGCPVIGGSVAVVTLGLEGIEQRAFCKYICPIGGVYVALSKIGQKFNYKVKLPVDNCRECRSCERACKYGVPILDYTRNSFKQDPRVTELANKMGITKEELLRKAWKENIPELKNIAKDYSIASPECAKCFECVNACPLLKVKK
ncbi:MAG: 4Fe-4S binding protein [Nitrososphaeria archaeon]